MPLNSSEVQCVDAATHDDAWLMCHDKGNPRGETPEYVNKCHKDYKDNDCYPPGDDKSGCIGDAITYCKSQYVTCPPPSPPSSPAAPVPVASPPPSPAPPPCKSSADLEACKDDCDAAFGVCKDTDTKKACKKIKKKCKKTCGAATPCAPPPTCEDNVPPGFTATWCPTNAKSATWCGSADGKEKCKKTCGLCP